MSGKIHIDEVKLRESYQRLGSLNAVCKEMGRDYSTIKRLFDQYQIKINVTHYKCDDDFFSRDDEKSFYWAGFWAADGSLMKTNGAYSIYLGLSSEDIAHMRFFQNQVKTDAPIKIRIRKNREILGNKILDTECCELKFSSKKMFNDLARFNIIPQKTYVYEMPEWLMNHKLLPHFLRGYIDGDGSFYLKKMEENKNVQVCFRMRGTAKFLNQFHQCVFPHMKRKDKRRREMSPQDQKPFDVIMYQGNGIVSDLSKFLYRDATIMLDRKYEIVKRLI